MPNQVDFVSGAAIVEHRLLNVVGSIDRQKHPARADVFVTEPLDRLTDGGGVNDRQHLFEVFAQQVIEEDFVAVAQLGEVHVFADGGARSAELFIDAAGLVFEARDPTGQQPDQPKQVPLGHREGCPAVGHGVGQHGPTARRNPHNVGADGRVLCVVAIAHRAEPRRRVAQ
jgi:hypothetical protein